MSTRNFVYNKSQFFIRFFFVDDFLFRFPNVYFYKTGGPADAKFSLCSYPRHEFMKGRFVIDLLYNHGKGQNLAMWAVVGPDEKLM